jgi:protoheme IX farnesyltransferase
MNLKDFLRISKAEITLLILIVAVTGFISAPSASSKVFLLVPLIFAGAFASMSASVLNNVYDMDLDWKMKRTSYRKEIVNSESYRRITILALVMLALSLTVSYIFINFLTMVFIFAGFLSYVVLYTIMLKRRTSLNIVIGGIAGSFPALAGWASVTGGVSWTAMFIAMLVFVWTPTHFWSLAMGTSEEYKQAGIPMLPAVVGQRKAAKYIVVNTIVMIVYSLLPLYFHQIAVGRLYYFVAVAADLILVYYLAASFADKLSVKSFRKTFHYTNLYLLILLVSIWWIVA